MRSVLANADDNAALRARASRAAEQLDRLSQGKSSSGHSSGISTPIAEDAPPSVQSISSARKQVRAQVKTRLFHNIDYQPRLSHFDPNSENQNFRGFFVLFWISLVIMVITTVLRNVKDTGYPLRVQVWSLLSANVFQLGLCDLAMVLSTCLTLPLHQTIRSSKGWLRWSNYGMTVQSLLQLAWLNIWVAIPFMLDWTWTAQVYLTLHTLVLLMKMHSYAFYNGHLSETERRLSSLDNPKGAKFSAAIRYPRYCLGIASQADNVQAINCQEECKKSVAELRSDLATELTSTLGHVTYPQNLTWKNYADFIMCPTLCYELEYPRTKETQWTKVLIKSLAVFGCIFLLTLTSEEFIVPVLNDSAYRLHRVDAWSEKGLILAETISMLLFPFMVTFLLVFLVIFEYTLGAFAEITRFADRRFYSDWWNSCDWLEFSREWNIPVHHFLRRHVYFSSLTKFSSSGAMFITFLVSSIGHELVMGCITKKLRGYGFLAMMLQLPIVAAQRSKFVKGRRTFNVYYPILLHFTSFTLTPSIIVERLFLDLHDSGSLDASTSCKASEISENMGKKLSPESQAAICSAIDAACKDPVNDLPNVSFVVVNKDGQEIIAHSSGTRGIGQSQAVAPDSVYWIASFTKMITGVACMQLVEQGKLALDDIELVEGLCPELKEVQVMQEDGTLVPKNRGITLRMLLSHTAGFGYSIFQERLKKQGYNEFSGKLDDFKQPLVNQPGEKWEYGINIDWAGVVVERASGMPLGEYFQKHIFEPLGLKEIGFFPSEEMKKKLVSVAQRAPDGTLSHKEHPNSQPLHVSSEEHKSSIFNSGGGGCFSTPRDYSQILATLMNDGVSPITGKRILDKTTIDSMFENQIPDWPDFGRVGFSAPDPTISNPLPALYPIPDGAPQGWGLTWMITPSPTGRSANSAFWAGITNCFWWCDREKEVAGVIATQLLPFGDPQLVTLWATVEAMVYAGLS
ncbi:Sterol O-acyltransferase 2 (Sterol-ester synthase 2) [Ophidiomyces ophidiicola]|nr:Sterol O-acyltransferase 2 (Sterol-ester synthase 2) [Ophidiomyces ophidiicola]KAI2017187.1 Sterol O-acyltransferase 2 (Sterol-ester synthase 2) [Ophidiomyces ophidiicola]KAI2067602.1 Sterol O-acyltransferase 2 (Sterol-ester synthase 2) [Ophidiomyces ophidiicola]KAI2140353.1 Sterol O-acyltransferase 2 (Sterol-ester synthase 2) [Ophidiomyces ophidiicola]KAI2156554.1 Sterol O-acyltransferase 2 (Sterol-ester synthase 2) [Ophidiomyces ophidiicola]